MSKYDALGRFLRDQKADLVPMTFREIERVTGTKLPSSKRYPAWWSNNTWNNVMTKVWRDAGYRSEQVDISHERLVFRRDALPTASASRAASAKSDSHPAFGGLEGTFTLEPDWDLTQPSLDRAETEILEKNLKNTADLIKTGLRDQTR